MVFWTCAPQRISHAALQESGKRVEVYDAVVVAVGNFHEPRLVVIRPSSTHNCAASC